MAKTSLVEQVWTKIHQLSQPERETIFKLLKAEIAPRKTTAAKRKPRVAPEQNSPAAV